MHDEKAEAVATYTARGREDAPAAPRHASLIVFVEINCFHPGDPQHCASQGVQLPVATAHTAKVCGHHVTVRRTPGRLCRSSSRAIHAPSEGRPRVGMRHSGLLVILSDD